MNKKHKPTSPAKYVKQGGEHCPNCGSTDIDGLGMVGLDRGIVCNNCGAEWELSG